MFCFLCVSVCEVWVGLLDSLFGGILATCKRETRAAETTASSLRQSSSAPPALKRPVSSFSVAARGQTRDSKNGPIARRLCRSGKIYIAINVTTGKTETVRCLNFRGLLQPIEFADPAPAIFLPRDTHATFYFTKRSRDLEDSIADHLLRCFADGKAPPLATPRYVHPFSPGAVPDTGSKYLLFGVSNRCIIIFCLLVLPS